MLRQPYLPTLAADAHAQKNLFEMLLDQTEIRLYLLFSGWFGTKRTSVWFQINRKMVNTIWYRFGLIRFRKDFSVCTHGKIWADDRLNAGKTTFNSDNFAILVKLIVKISSSLNDATNCYDIIQQPLYYTFGRWWS